MNLMAFAMDHHLGVWSRLEISVPVGIAVVSAFGCDEHNAVRVVDGRGQVAGPGKPGLTSGGVQLDRRHPEWVGQ